MLCCVVLCLFLLSDDANLRKTSYNLLRFLVVFCILHLSCWCYFTEGRHTLMCVTVVLTELNDAV